MYEVLSNKMERRDIRVVRHDRMNQHTHASIGSLTFGLLSGRLGLRVLYNGNKNEMMRDKIS